LAISSIAGEAVAAAVAAAAGEFEKPPALFYSQSDSLFF
jgi:hypothetical protein